MPENKTNHNENTASSLFDTLLKTEANHKNEETPGVDKSKGIITGYAQTLPPNDTSSAKDENQEGEDGDGLERLKREHTPNFNR